MAAHEAFLTPQTFKFTIGLKRYCYFLSVLLLGRGFSNKINVILSSRVVIYDASENKRAQPMGLTELNAHNKAAHLL